MSLLAICIQKSGPLGPLEVYEEGGSILGGSQPPPRRAECNNFFIIVLDLDTPIYTVEIGIQCLIDWK